MPLPGSVTMVTVNGTILHPITGVGATGSVTFTIPQACRTNNGYVIGNLPPVIATVTNGVFTVSLPATDNPNVIPQGWVYTVAVATDAYVGVFQAALASTPNPTTFAAMTPVSGTTPVAVYVPLTAVGVASGVASLDVTGKVPASELPTSATGVLSVTAANGTVAIGGTGTNPTVAVGTGIPESAVTGLVTDLAAKAPDSLVVHLAGTETVTGAKTFTAAPVVPAAAFPEMAVANLTADLAGKVPTATVTTKGDLIAATGSAAVARLGAGANGQTLVADSTQATGLRWAAGGVTIRSAWITGGDTALPNTAGLWAAVAGFELDLPAVAGQWVEIGVHGMRSDTGSAFLDIAVIVGSGLVRFLASGTATPGFEGDPGWYSNSSSFNGQSSVRGFVATSGDLDGGNVRFVLAAKAAGAGTVYSSTTYPFYWVAKNLGVPA